MRASGLTDALIASVLRGAPGLLCSNLYRAGPRLHRMGAIASVSPAVGLGMCLALALPGIVGAAEHTDATGWLQLERDQRTYRERAGPLDLRESRELPVIERRQRDDLRALEQRLDRDARLEQRLGDAPAPRSGEPGAVTPPPRMPRRENPGSQRRALERLRLQRRMRQYRQPFGRMRPR